MPCILGRKSFPRRAYHPSVSVSLARALQSSRDGCGRFVLTVFRRRPMNRKLLLTGVLSVCLFAVSSRALAQDAPTLFTGKLGDHVRVAATAANGKIALFFCGDASTVSTQSHWLIDGFQL